MASRKSYIDVYNKALKLTDDPPHFYRTTINDIKAFFNIDLNNEDFINDTALSLQICIKKSLPMYLHGYLVSYALNDYLTQGTQGTGFKNAENTVQIFETGTARGFSSVCMASILNNYSSINSNIITLDHLPINHVRNWNCIHDFDENGVKNYKSRLQIIDLKFKHLREKYISLKETNSNDYIMNNPDNLSRINFAFLDGAHYYKDLMNEINFVVPKQLSGDVIIIDDYTNTQYPEIVSAVDELIGRNMYSHHIFYGNDGTKKRGYVYLVKY